MATMACDNEEVSREFTLDSVMADASDASDIPDTPTNGSDASIDAPATDTSTVTDTEDADDSSMDTMEPPEDTSPDVPPTPTDHRPVLLINAGSDAPLTDRWGRTWEADRGWIGDGDETAAHTEASVVGTPSPELFQSERRCMSGYQLPLEEGQYTVRLHMAEQADDVTTVGQRLSNLDIEGRTVEHFDPLYEARGPGRATVLTVEALDVVDGTLDIAFGSVVQCANINAIEVLERLEETCNTDAPARRWWPDADGDGRGDRHARPTVAPCAPPAPYAHVEDDADCDDADPTDEASEACAFEPADCDVWITPSFDAATTVVAGAPGTHYCFRAGIHRLSSAIDPKEGDRFTGEYGAIISGARDLSADSVDWIAQEDGTWCVGGQEQNLAETLYLSTNFGGDVDPEMLPGTYFPEELFSNDRRLTRLSPHTESRADLGPGSWLLDTDRQEICVGDDPATLGRLETSVIPHALTGGRVSDVVVDNLIFEKFAGGWRRAIIGGWFQSPGFDWTVRYSEIRWSH
ncbi:MAG: malectin domain-containing carbohydrate-binding protein, partial [Myxococcota bacterium]